MKQVYASLDFGSSTLKLVVAEVINSYKQVLYSKQIQSHGIENGLIVDQEAVKEDVKKIIELASDDLGAPITKVLLNIPAKECSICSTSATVKILSDDKVISANDVLKALKLASKVDMRNTEQMVTCIPVKYIYERLEASKIEIETTKVPIGKVASSLTVEALVIISSKAVFYPFLKVVEGSGLEILDVCINAYAGAKEVFSKETLDEGAILIDIGHQTSTVSYFKDGYIQYIRVIDKGSEYLSKRVSRKWQIPLEKVEQLKIDYGSCTIDETDHDALPVVDDKQETTTFYRNDLTMALIEGVEELLLEIKQKLTRHIDLEGLAIYIVGGGAKLEGIDAVATRVLQVPVQTYTPATYGARDMSYVNNLGLIYFVMDREIIFGNLGISVDMPNYTNTLTLKMKGLTKTQTENKFKNFITENVIVDEDEE